MLETIPKWVVAYCFYPHGFQLSIDCHRNSSMSSTGGFEPRLQPETHPGETCSLAALALCHWLWLRWAWQVFHGVCPGECDIDTIQGMLRSKQKLGSGLKPQPVNIVRNLLFSDVGHCWSMSMPSLLFHDTRMLQVKCARLNWSIPKMAQHL